MKETAIQLQKGKQRYAALDTIRGLTLFSMILYHATWDLVYVHGLDWAWYRSSWAYLWQQSICWCFILLSGFCWSLGKHHLGRGVLTLGCGLLITELTILFLWEDRVIFGVLTFLGIAMLLMIPLDRLIAGVQRHMNATIGNAVGLVCSLAVFVITRNVNRGSLGFEAWIFYQMPEEVYQGDLTAYLGFPGQGFYSTDYFSLFPWFFLFLAGYFLYHLTKKNRQYTAEDSGLGTEQEKTIEKKSWLSIDIKPFSFLGRHSLLIYMLHQPVLFGLFMLLFQS